MSNVEMASLMARFAERLSEQSRQFLCRGMAGEPTAEAPRDLIRMAVDALRERADYLERTFLQPPAE